MGEVFGELLFWSSGFFLDLKDPRVENSKEKELEIVREERFIKPKPKAENVESVGEV